MGDQQRQEIDYKIENKALIFGGTDKEISEKRNFFENRSVPENFVTPQIRLSFFWKIGQTSAARNSA